MYFGAGHSYYSPGEPADEIKVDEGVVYFSLNLQRVDSISYGRFSESDRVDTLKEFLRKNLPSGLQCTNFSENREKHVPFKGGGDLLIRSVNQLKSCCILESDSSDIRNCSPRYDDDCRFTTIEAKIGTTQSDLDILLQLQANMLLSTVDQLQYCIREGIITFKELTTLRQITTYGLALCATDKYNVLIRMTSDLNTNTVTFERLFAYSSFAQGSTKFDSILEFVVRRLLVTPESRPEPEPTSSDDQ